MLFCLLVQVQHHFSLLRRISLRDRPQLLLLMQIYEISLCLLVYWLHKAHTPVENVVENFDTLFEGRVENELFEHLKISLFLKIHGCHIIHVFEKLAWTTSAQAYVGNLLLISAECSIARRWFCSVDVLPRQTAFKKVYDYVAEGNQVITARELVAFVCVDGDISASADQILVILERQMFSSMRIYNLTCQTKINQMDGLRFFTQAQHNVVWF